MPEKPQSLINAESPHLAESGLIVEKCLWILALLLKLPTSCQERQGRRNLNYSSPPIFILGTDYLLGNDYSRSRFSPGTCLWLAWQLLSPPGTSLQTEHAEQLIRTDFNLIPSHTQQPPLLFCIHFKPINSVQMAENLYLSLK